MIIVPLILLDSRPEGVEFLPMQFRRLGKTGVSVSRIGLGCGGFGGIGSAPAFFGMGESETEARKIMDAAWELGITLFDTADAYGGGRSERTIGTWLRSKGPRARDRIVLTTKVFHSVVGDPRDRGLRPARIARQIEGSLSRLGVERVELYMTHEPDPETPLEETLGALESLVRAGKIAAFGACNIKGPQIAEARGAFGWVQNSYSLLDRGAETDVLPVCAREGIGFTPFSPLAGGWLTGKYAEGVEPPPGSRMALRPESYRRFESAATHRAIARFCELARQRGEEPAALAIAWLLAHPQVDAVIVGPRRPEHLKPALRALELALSPSERDGLVAAIMPPRYE
jgi:aryl-alcohol dehydrogenase-like predicted oxidoreductase